MIHKEAPQFLNPPRRGAPHAALLNWRALLAGPARFCAQSYCTLSGYAWTTERTDGHFCDLRITPR
jgi:hypothetical protein